MAKYAAIALDLDDIDVIPFFIIVGGKIKTFKSEEEAEQYVNKTFYKNVVLYGVIDSPEQIVKQLKKTKKSK